MLIETKNVLQIMSINWYFINFIFSFLKIFKESGLKFSKWNLINNTLHLNLFIPTIFWNLSKEKNGAIFLIIKDHLHPTEIIIWVAPRSNLMLFFWMMQRKCRRCSPASHDEDDEAGEKRRKTLDFSNYERLRESDKAFRGKKPFICNICEKNSLNFNALHLHRQSW